MAPTPRIRILTTLTIASLIVSAPATQESGRTWLAGDPHVHSRWSVGWDVTKTPPTLNDEDAVYSIIENAEKARQFGLTWMAATDHGHIDHATLNLTKAYPELLESRKRVPELLQFYGLELNMPGMDHHTVIVPHTEAEATTVFEIEKRFDAFEPWPPRDPARQSDAARLALLAYLQGLQQRPLVFANHPARTAAGLGSWGQSHPTQFRQNMDAAPEVYRGMEAAPGHQAKTLERDGSRRNKGRGSYGRKKAQTLGGYDQMTAVLGGVWDALLGEGRRFWITAASDSHIHYRDPAREGDDFWPGEFQKTYVLAKPTYDDVFDSLKRGRMFVTAGDLITELDVTATAGDAAASVGETLRTDGAQPITVTIRLKDPESPNAGGQNPRVARVDLIVGEVRSGVSDRNETTKVVHRFSRREWVSQGEVHELKTTVPAARSSYLRVRGTSSDELEPSMDDIGENPWSDLWFYSNPIFIEVSR